MATLEALRRRAKSVLTGLLAPLTWGLLRLHVTPTHVSIFSVALAVAAATAIILGSFVTAAVLFLMAALMDVLDGAMARKANRASDAGALLDSTVDRIVEGIVFAGLAYRFAAEGRAFAVSMVVLALAASLLISYTRARSEGLGVACSVGIITRAERVAILFFGFLFSAPAIAVYVLLALSAISVAQRLHYSLSRLS